MKNATTDPRSKRRVEFSLREQIGQAEYLMRIVMVANQVGLEGLRISSMEPWEQDNLFGVEFLLQPREETKAKAPRKHETNKPKCRDA